MSVDCCRFSLLLFSNIRFSRLLLIGICDYKWTQQGNRLKRNHRLKGIRFITTFFFIGVLSYFTGSSYSIFYTSSIRSQPTGVHTHTLFHTDKHIQYFCRAVCLKAMVRASHVQFTANTQMYL